MKQELNSLKAQKAEMEQRKADVKMSRNGVQKRVRIAKLSDGPR